MGCQPQGGLRSLDAPLARLERPQALRGSEEWGWVPELLVKGRRFPLAAVGRCHPFGSRRLVGGEMSGRRWQLPAARSQAPAHGARSTSPASQSAQDSVLMVFRVQDLVLETQKSPRDFLSSSPCSSLPAAFTPSEERCLSRGCGRGCLFV